MTISASIFSNVNDRFESCFEDVDVRFYPYEGAGLLKIPCATMVPAGFDEVEMLDQSSRIGRMQFTLRYYVAMSKDARQAYADLQSGIPKCVRAVGNAATGGAVRAAWIDRARISPIVTQQNKLELMCEMDVTVVPGSNAS